MKKNHKIKWEGLSIYKKKECHILNYEQLILLQNYLSDEPIEPWQMQLNKFLMLFYV